MFLLPKELDEKVARLHLPALGAELSQLPKVQADYIGVPLAGPYKGDALLSGVDIRCTGKQSR